METKELREYRRSEMERKVKEAGVKALLMEAGRHLSASRWAWVLSKVGSWGGISGDYTGCTKGHMAEDVAKAYGRNSIDVTIVIKYANNLQAQENSKGETGWPT